MQRWGLVITALYALILIALLFPGGLYLAGESYPDALAALFDRDALSDLAWLGWLFIGLFALAQAALFFVAVDVTRRRPQALRPMAIPVTASAFAVGVMSIAILLCVIVLATGDAIFDAGWFWIVFPLANWAFWGAVFWLYRERVSARLDRTLTWLLRGSVLQLLIAIPSHAYIRQRDDCCAPAVTGYGIATGIALMLMTLGPSVVFLYQKRIGEYRTEPPALPAARWAFGITIGLIITAAASLYLFVPVQERATATGTASIVSTEIPARVDALTRLVDGFGMSLTNDTSLFGLSGQRWRIRCANRTVAQAWAAFDSTTRAHRWSYEIYAGEFASEPDYEQFAEAVRASSELSGGLDSHAAPERNWLSRITSRTRAGTAFGSGCRIGG